MIYINTYIFNASTTGHDIHTFLLIRLLTTRDSECRVYAEDLGKVEATLDNILIFLCDNKMFDILDQIVEDEMFYLNNVTRHVTCIRPTSNLSHRGKQYKVG